MSLISPTFIFSLTLSTFTFLFPSLSALRKGRMETSGGRRGPLSFATMGSRATLLWMLWAGYDLATKPTRSHKHITQHSQ